MSGTITHDVTSQGVATSEVVAQPDGRGSEAPVPAQRTVPPSQAGVSPGAAAHAVAAGRARAAQPTWRLNVLGPVQLCYDGQSVEVSGVTHTLLVLLARCAGDEVSTASIIAGVWGSEPPVDAESSIASSVSRLRKALTAVAPNVDPTSVVVTMPTGYILDVPAPNVDVATFERLVADAQRALEVGQPRLTVARADAALALWRGEAYADVREQSFARAEVARLNDLRLAAVELRVEAVLAIAAPGVPDSLVPELDALITEHWHRERLWAALMTALYRLGRRSEALAAHRQAQVRLAEGLHAQPGSRLRATERTVLDRDPALYGRPLTMAPLPAATAVTTPACVGRDEEVDWLESALDLAATRRSQARLIVGAPGIGKTRLVADVAQRAAARGVIVRYSKADADGVGALVAEPDRLSLVVVDDADLATPQGLSAILEFVRATVTSSVHVPVLTLLTCRDAARVGDLVGLPKLVLTALDEASVAAIVRVYAPSATDVIATSAMVNTGGVPARVHRAASEWAFARAGRRIDRAVEASVDPRRWLSSVRAEVRGGVLELGHVRAQARLLRPTHHHNVIPYKGLASYDAADADIMHGRDAIVAELVARMVEAPFLALVGGAGTGKSSVVRAGLLPALAMGVLPDSAGWRQVVVTPAAVESLASHLVALAAPHTPDSTVPSSAASSAASSVVSSVTSAVDSHDVDGDSAVTSEPGVSDGAGMTNGAGMSDGARAADDPHSATATADVVNVLVVDQFEEVFTHLDARSRHEFLGTVVQASRSHRIVLILRSEFYPHCVAHPELSSLIAANTFALTPLSIEQLRQAIERPAAMAEVPIAPEVIEAILDDTADNPGDLASVSAVLLAMWDSGELTLSSYRASGGVADAIEVVAERAYAALTTDAQRVAARRLLSALVGDSDGTLVRLRLDVADLLGSIGPGAAGTLEILFAHRLVIADGDAVMLVHDSLLTGWPRLRSWVDDVTAEAHLRRHLARAAAAWAAAGADTGSAHLYGGVRLAAALDWATAHPREVNGTEQAFLMASRQVLLAAELRRRRRVTRLWKWLAAMTLALLAAVAIAAVAVVELASVDRAGQRADAARLAAQAGVEPDLRLALLLAVAAGKLDPSASGAVRDVLMRSPDLAAATGSAVTAVTVSPDGARIAMGSSDGSVAVLRAGGLADISRFDGAGQASVSGLAFTPDARRLVSWGAASTGQTTGSIVVWDVATASPVGPAFGQVSAGATGGLLADGVTLLLSQRGPAGAPTTTVAWNIDARTPSTAYQLPEAAAEGLAISANGRRVAWGSGEGAIIVDPATGNSHLIEGATRPAALSPDGSRMLTVEVGALVAWDLSTGRRLGEARRHAADILAAAWSTDGQAFASVGADGLVVVWDARTLQPTRVMTGSLMPVRMVSFAADSQALYTVGDDGALLVWDLTATRGIGAALANPDDADLTRVACAIVGRDMTREEWTRRVGERAYQHVCPH